MLKEVTAIRFDGRVGSGKTKPCRITCAEAEGAEHELIVKFSAGCERGVRALIAEAIAAMLAADLELPVPEPFLANIESDFVEIIKDNEVKELARKSLGWNYGSKRLPPGYSTWPRNRTVSQSLLPLATEIFAFDALIQNPDRREANPNCLVYGNELAVYDHELAFTGELMIGWLPPWEAKSLEYMKAPAARHAFYKSLQGTPVNLDRLFGAWSEISGERIEQYGRALPPSWLTESSAITSVLNYLNELRVKLNNAFEQVKEILQ